MGNLYHLFFYVAIGVGVLVYGLIIWSAIRYRRRRTDTGELPRQFRYQVPLEITYTAIPVLIVVGLMVATFRTEQRVNRLVPQPAVVVNVTGFQWQWRFDYPASGVSVVGTPTKASTMVVPVGQTVRINLVARDVIHSFYVVPTAGTFRGECAEYCGLNHGDMDFSVKAVAPAQFQQWLAAQSSGASG